MTPFRAAMMIAAAAFALTSPARGETILFVGNSFTFAALSPAWHYRPDTVTDLNGEGVGGVPALFKRFADELGLHEDVSLETAPGRALEWHWANKRALIDRRWDQVVLQEYSTLDPDRPGNPAKLVAYSGKLAALVRARDPRARISLTATWSRPDLTFPRGKPWSGKPIARMALDLRRGADLARRVNPAIARVIPVGEAFNCAIALRVADANPYDGISSGQVSLWAGDHYHGSTAGYYLEALTVFAAVTGHDPRALGRAELAAADLGLEPKLAAELQSIAWQMVRGHGCDTSRPRTH